MDTSAENPSVLDAETLRAILELDATAGEELLRELIGAYVRLAADRAADMAAALARGDLVALAFAAHNLKSSAANLGAPAVAAACQALESLREAKDLAPVAAALAALQAATAAATAELQAVARDPSRLAG